MSELKAYLGVARAPFLLLPVTLVAAGTAVAAWEGRFEWGAALLALVGLVALHMAVNILNEVSDFATRIDFHTERTPFSGGSGTLPAGAMGTGAARVFGLACATLGGAIGVWFLTRVGWPLLPVMVLGAVAVLAYTPVLASSGLGEVFAGLGLGLLPVWGTALVVRGGMPGAATVAASLPAFFMTFNLLLLNEFPDESADRQGGRRNLVILLGRRGAATVYAVAALAVPIVIVVAVALRVLPALALLAALPSVLLVAPVRWALTTPHQGVPIPALGANVVWNLATNTVLAITLGIAAAL
jgi:1,4-dihydroxy-2-naphthoate octaprenyltransferase